MKLLKEYSTLEEAINYLKHETGVPVDLDYLIELEKENRLKMLVYYHGQVNIVTNKITSSSTKLNDKTVSKYLEAIFKPTQKSVIEKHLKLLLGDEDSIYNYQYFVVHRLFNDPNFIPAFSISSDIYIDIDEPIIVKFDREQVTKDDIRISSSDLTKIIENFSYHELQEELENLKTEYSNITEQLRVAKAELINESANQLSENTAKDYQVTIGLLLELLQRKPKGFNRDGKDLPPLFSSQTKVLDAIEEQVIPKQRYKKLEKRFSLANAAALEAKKNRPRPIDE